MRRWGQTSPGLILDQFTSVYYNGNRPINVWITGLMKEAVFEGK